MRFLQHRLCVAAFILFIALVGASNAAWADAVLIPTDQNAEYVHEPSNFHFPSSLGTFQRGEVNRYDDTGRDISVGYNNQPAVLIAMTVYVYPAGDAPLERHFKQVVSDVIQAHPDARTESTGAWGFQQSKREFAGLKAVFSFNSMFARKQRDVMSEAYLLKLGDNLVKYRVTYPAEQRKEARKLIDSFINDLGLPNAQ